MLFNKKVLIFLASVLAVLGFKSMFYPFVQTTASYLLYPMLWLQQKTIDPIKRASSHPNDYSALLCAYTELEHAYVELMQAYIQSQASNDLYAHIEELLQFKQRYTTDQAILTQIIARYKGDDEQYILVDKGANHGIKGHMVLVYKDMLVGRVHEVFPLYSKCILITDSRCKVPAYCTTTQALGVTAGHNTKIALAHVSHLDTVKKDDLLISSGHGKIFPRGFGIAQITDYSKDGLVYAITCKPLIDAAQLTYCYVIEKGT